MYCQYCGSEVPGNTKFCSNCGAPVTPAASTTAQPTVETPSYEQMNYAPYQPNNIATNAATKSKVAAGLLGIFLGTLGIHKFYLGYTKQGVIMLLISIIAGIFTFGLATGVMEIIAFIEGIIYLTKSDEEFYLTYELGQKPWF